MPNNDLRDDELRREDLRRDDLRRVDDRKRGSWAAPLIVLALVIGVGWWLLDRANDGVIDEMPNAVLTPDRPLGAPPVVTPNDGALVIPNDRVEQADAAVIGTATGRIEDFDPQRRTMTLDNGETFVLATNVTTLDAVTPGQRVTLTYRLDNDQKVVQSLLPAPGEATPGVAPNYTPTPGFEPMPGMAPNEAPLAPANP